MTVTIRRFLDDHVEIATPYNPHNREILTPLVPGLDWDRFLQRWTGVIDDSRLERLVRTLRATWLMTVRVEEEQPHPEPTPGKVTAEFNLRWRVREA